MNVFKFAVVVAAFSCATVATAQDQLVVANEGDYPPFSITKSDGTLTGLDVEVARKLCERIEATCEFRVMEFSSQLPSLVAGRIDMIGNHLYPKPERLEAVDFLEPHVRVQDGWLIPNDLGIEPAEGAMSGKRIGIIEGAAWIAWLEDEQPDAELVTYQNLQSILLDLKAGRIDMTYGPQLGLAQLTSEMEIDETYSFVPYTLKGREELSSSYAVQKGNTDLAERLNAALAEIFEDCTYTQVRQEFADVPLSPREPETCL